MPTFVFAFLSPFFNVLNGYFYGLKLRVPFTGNVKQKTSLFSVQGKSNKSQQFQGFCSFVSSHLCQVHKVNAFSCLTQLIFWQLPMFEFWQISWHSSFKLTFLMACHTIPNYNACTPYLWPFADEVCDRVQVVSRVTDSSSPSPWELPSAPFVDFRPRSWRCCSSRRAFSSWKEGAMSSTICDTPLLFLSSSLDFRCFDDCPRFSFPFLLPREFAPPPWMRQKISVSVKLLLVFIYFPRDPGGALPIMACTGRLRPKGAPFSGFICMISLAIWKGREKKDRRLKREPN